MAETSLDLKTIIDIVRDENATVAQQDSEPSLAAVAEANRQVEEVRVRYEKTPHIQPSSSKGNLIPFEFLLMLCAIKQEIRVITIIR